MLSRIVLTVCFWAVIFTAWPTPAQAKSAPQLGHASTGRLRFVASAECLEPIESSYRNPFSWAQWSSSRNSRRRKDHRCGRSAKGFGANLAVTMALMSRGRSVGAIALEQGATAVAAAIAFKQWLQTWPGLARIVATPGAITMQMG
jgi:hypothetical protein